MRSYPILMEKLLETKTPTVQTFSKSMEKCARTPRLHKEPIFGRAINMQSRRPTENVFTFWSLRMGVIEKEKMRSNPLIREGQQSNKYAI